MHEFEWKGAQYRIGDLTPMQEFHCVRRVAPILAAMGVGLAELKAAAAEDMFMRGGAIALDVLAKMSNEDVEYVVNTCLGVVRRRVDETKHAPVMVGGSMQYQDIDMPAMVRLCFEVLRGRIGDFFGPPTDGAGTS